MNSSKTNRVRLGMFDPINEMDSWLSAYHGDLNGDATVPESRAAKEPWRFVSVSSPKVTAALRLDSYGNLSTSYQHGSEKREEQYEGDDIRTISGSLNLL